MASKDLQETINTHLPSDIVPGETRRKCMQDFVQNFLLSRLPAGDSKKLKDEMKWKFLLDRHFLVKKKNKIRRRKTYLTRKERVEQNLLKLPKDGWDYNSLEPLRSMWKDYMKQNLELVNGIPNCTETEWNNFSTIVSKSELVGSEIKIIRSQNPILVGLRGTVVLETKSTFQIVTQNSQLKVIVKPSSVFEIYLDDIKFTIFGKHITTKPSERSVKKIKSNMSPDL